MVTEFVKANEVSIDVGVDNNIESIIGFDSNGNNIWDCNKSDYQDSILSIPGAKTVKFRMPLTLLFKPLPDITAFELANVVIVYFTCLNGYPYYQEDFDKLDEGVKRHFNVINYNSEELAGEEVGE